MSISKSAVVEAVKEGGRLAFFAAIAALVAYATERLGAFDPSSVYVVVGTALLRVVDKYVHENKDIEAQGVAPF